MCFDVFVIVCEFVCVSFHAEVMCLCNTHAKGNTHMQLRHFCNTTVCSVSCQLPGKHCGQEAKPRMDHLVSDCTSRQLGSVLEVAWMKPSLAPPGPSWIKPH